MTSAVHKLPISRIPAGPRPVETCPGRYHRGWKFIGGFEDETRTGILYRSVPDGGLVPLTSRPGWTLVDTHDVLLRTDDTRIVVAVWRSFPDGGQSIVEVWTETGSREDPRFEKRDMPRPRRWENARVDLRRCGPALVLSVVRELVGENRETPRVRKLERFRISRAGVRRIEELHMVASTPAQLLNQIADRLDQRDRDGARALLEELRHRAPGHVDRGELLLAAADSDQLRRL